MALAPDWPGTEYFPDWPRSGKDTRGRYAGDWLLGGHDDRPSAARIYDALLGGSHNFAVDRAAAADLLTAIPDAVRIAQTNRAFIHRAVRHLTRAGIRQFLDIGSGMATFGPVHQIAQHETPDARVVYIDLDPIVVAHTVNAIRTNLNTRVAQADLAYPDAVLEQSAVRDTLDLDQPVALILGSVLQFLPDEEAYPAVARLGDKLAAGSYLVLSHPDLNAIPRPNAQYAAHIYWRTDTSDITLRDNVGIAAFFNGFELVAPGLVPLPQWRPQGELEEDELRRQPHTMVGGVARKC